MSRKSLRSLTYQVWVRCICGGNLESLSKTPIEYLAIRAACLSCKEETLIYGASPRSVKRYEVIK